MDNFKIDTIVESRHLKKAVELALDYAPGKSVSYYRLMKDGTLEFYWGLDATSTVTANVLSLVGAYYTHIVCKFDGPDAIAKFIVDTLANMPYYESIYEEFGGTCGTAYRVFKGIEPYDYGDVYTAFSVRKVVALYGK